MMKTNIVKLYIILPLMLIIAFGTALTTNAAMFDCAANQHDYMQIEYTPATDTTDGRAVYECRLCGRRVTRYLPAVGWGEWIVTTPPTCTQTGLRMRTSLNNPGYSEIEEVPATGHQFTETIIQPTCTEQGRRIRTCSECGYSYTTVFGTTGECNYTENITREPTCTAQGEITFTCEICGDYYMEPIPALEHAFGEWVINIPAEQGIDGQKYMECVHCGERIYETIPALPTEPEPQQRQWLDAIGPTEIVVTTANVGLWIIGPILLFGEFMYIILRRKKKRNIEAQRRDAYSGKDGYKWI